MRERFGTKGVHGARIESRTNQQIVFAEDVIRSFRISDSSSQSGINTGFATMREIRVDLEGDYSELDTDGMTFDAYVTQGNASIRYGTDLTVASAKISDGVTKLELYDRMYKHEVKYSSELTFPTKAGSVLTELATKRGYAIPSISSVAWKNVVVNKAPEDITERQMIAYVMQLCGGYIARFDAFGNMTFGMYEKSEPVATLNALIAEDYEQPVTITGISCNQNGTETICGTEGYVIELTLNPLIDENNVDDVLLRIAQNYVGLCMSPLSISIDEACEYECCDKIKIVDRLGVERITYITSVDTSIQDTTEIACSAMPKSKQRAYSGGVAQRIIEKAARQTDEKITEYDATVQSLTDTITHGLGLYTTRVEQADGSIITYMHDKPLMEDSLVRFFATSNGLIGQKRESTSDKWETTAALSAMGQALVQILTVQGLNASWINTGELVIKDRKGNITMYVNADTGEVRMNASSIIMTGGGNVEDALDDLQIGTRNYAENTSSEWCDWKELKNTTNQVVYIAGTGINVKSFDMNNKGLKAGDTLRLSFEIEYSDDTTMEENARIFVQGNRNAGGTYASISITGGTDESNLKQIASKSKIGKIETYIVLPNNFADGTYTEKWYLGVRHDYVTGKARIRNAMLNYGDKWLDWAPAPEDVSANIQKIGTKVDTSIEQLPGKINLEVSKVEVGNKNLYYVNDMELRNQSGCSVSIGFESRPSLPTTSVEMSYVQKPGVSIFPVNVGKYFICIDEEEE